MFLFDMLRQVFAARRPRGGAAAPAVTRILPPLVTPPLDRVYNYVSSTFWGSTNPALVKSSAEQIAGVVSGGYHFADNFLTWGRNMSMLDDAAFVDAWRSNTENGTDDGIVWRRYVLACAAYHCVQLDGDFVECGAYTGVAMKTVVDYLGGTAFPKTFWGYDIFAHDATMPNPALEGHQEDLFERVREKFSDYPQVRLVKGLIPEVFARHCPDRIAYLHIDLNQAPAEVAALEALFERMVPGAILILDDYEWSGFYRPQKLAEDVWFEARRYRVMPLPTGQGLVIKR